MSRPCIWLPLPRRKRHKSNLFVEIVSMRDKDIALRVRWRGRPPGGTWRLCGDDSGYGLFKGCRPKDVAVRLVRLVFSDDEIARRRFVYVVRRYRGRNNLQDTITIWEKISNEDV